MSDASAVFELVGVTVRYPGHRAAALDGVSLSVRPAECVGLVGPNGAGKTTALRALLGVVRCTAGRAAVLGRDSATWPREELAREVGVVAQREEPAFPVTVREVVEMGRYAHVGPWRSLATRDRDAVRRALRRADVERFADRLVQTLSGGEWQRVRVARALAQEPRALVLDEPTASLDIRHEMELFELVADLVDRDGLAALIVSHHINVAARFATRLALLADGRLVADAAPDVVLAPERVEAVFGWPVAVHRLPDGAVQIYPERRPRPQAPPHPDPGGTPT